MKKSTTSKLHKKKSFHTMMLLTLLAPSLLSAPFVLAEERTTETAPASEPSSAEMQETTDTTVSSSETIESTTSEEALTTSSSFDAETVTSTTQHEQKAAVTPRAVDTITFSDPILKQEVVAALRLPAGSEVTKAEMATLTTLSLSSAQISNLSGLEYATNLSSFYIMSTNNVTDFSPLEQLSALTYVTLQSKSLTSNNFPDLSKSSGLVYLSLSSSSIDNAVLPKIAQLTTLNRVFLDSNMAVTTIEPLKTMPNLTSLSVQFCGVTDFTVVPEFSPTLTSLSATGQNTGRNDPPSTITRSLLTYDTAQQSLFIPFSLMPNRLTNFDGYQPPFSLSNSANNTYLDFNGTQLTPDRLQITDQGITVLNVTEDEYKNLSTLRYNPRLNNPSGSYAKPAGFTFYAISSGTYLHQFNVIGQDVTVQYQDTDGNALLPDETYSGPVGGDFTIPAPTIPDYELTNTVGNPIGKFTDSPQSVLFVYKKVVTPPTDTSSSSTDSSTSTTDPSSSTTNTTSNNTTTDSTSTTTANNQGSNGTTTPSTSNLANKSYAKKNLPKAGEEATYAWTVLGLVLIGFVGTRFVFKKIN